MALNSFDYSRLIYLNQRIKDNLATKAEKDEYMTILYRNGNISPQQYQKYQTNGNGISDEIVKTALVVGGIILVAYLLGELFNKK